MQEKPLQVLNLGEPFHDARIMEKFKRTHVIFSRNMWKT
jgi:hypothetical protein